MGHVWVLGGPVEAKLFADLLLIKAALRLACENAFQFRYWHRAAFGHSLAEVRYGPSWRSRYSACAKTFWTEDGRFGLRAELRCNAVWIMRLLVGQTAAVGTQC